MTIGEFSRRLIRLVQEGLSKKLSLQQSEIHRTGENSINGVWNTENTVGCRGDGVPLLQAPWRITFDTNPDDCNLSCTMCEEHSEFSMLKRARIETGRPHRRMDIGIIRTTVKELVSSGLREIIPSTMGEPLLYSHFNDILDMCSEFHVKLNLTTNGTWLKFGPEHWAELICPVASDVKISWNGVSNSVQEGIMRGSKLEQRVSDLKKFIAVRDKIAAAGGNRSGVTLQCTFMESNLTELPHLVRFASDIGADRVKGHHLWVHFNEMKEQDMRRSVASISRWNRVANECRRAARSCGRERGRPLTLQNFAPLEISGNNHLTSILVCPFLGREAWINYEGRFDPCCAPDAERKSLGSFGNVSGNGGIIRIWKGPEYRELLANYLSHPLCSKCTMRRPVGEMMKI